MIVTILQESLKRGLAIVSNAVAGKSTLPVLANVLIATDGGRLKLAATNLEIGLTHWIGAEVEVEGAITLPAKLLSDVVNSLPNDKVMLTLDARTQSVKIECGRFTTNIKGIEADEFPAIMASGLTHIGGNVPPPIVTLPADLLTAALHQTVFAAVKDDSPPVLAGVLMRVNGPALFLAAADGFRLAVRLLTLPEASDGFEVIVPARALDTLTKIAVNADSVAIRLTGGGNQIMFSTDDTELSSRLIEGRFPDVERIIPTQYTTRAIVDTVALAKAVKLAAPFATASQNVIKLTMQTGEPGQIAISANASEIGDSAGEIDAAVTGEGGPISLNVAFVAELLGVIKASSIAIETQTPQSPAVIKPVGVDGYTCVIMPMSPR
jgi:DNA polymerase III subunit beta